MNITLRLIPLVATFLALPSYADDQQLLHYVELEHTLELTVPAGGVWLVIPTDGFERLRPLASGVAGPRTFDLIDRERKIEILGAFDSASQYPGLKRYWSDELEALRIEEGPEPRNILFTREGEWDLIVYETVKDGRTSSHVRAETIQDQMWIDVHVEASGNGDAALLRETALSVLKGMVLRED